MTRADARRHGRLLAHARRGSTSRRCARSGARASCRSSSPGRGAARRSRASASFAATARWRRCATPPSPRAGRTTSCCRRRRRSPPTPPSWRRPTDDPERPFEHIAFTVAYNMSEQPAASIDCGRTARRLADRPADRRPPPRRPRRAAGRARLGSDAAGAAAVAGAAGALNATDAGDDAARRARQSGLDRIGDGARRERASALANDVVLRHAARRPRRGDRRRPGAGRCRA